MAEFDFKAPADLFPSRSRKGNRPVGYRRFDTAAEAIRFAIEDMPVDFLLGTVLAVVANDVGALFAGRRFGRRPIAAAISPNKTIEGALGGALASVVVSYVVLDLIGLHPWEAKAGAALALGLLVAVLAPIGDLMESMLKREAGVKDSSHLIPGHGGALDRVDSLLFTLPFGFVLLERLLAAAPR